MARFRHGRPGNRLLGMHGYQHIVGFSHPDEVCSQLHWVNVQLRLQSVIHVITSFIHCFVYFISHPYLEVVKDQEEMKRYRDVANGSADFFDRSVWWRSVAQRGGALATLVSWRKFVTNRYLSKTVYLILCMGCSVLGATYDPFFFAFHLLELFFVVQLLQVALDAVSRNGSQLMYAVLMGLILTYIFAVLGWKLIIAHDIIQYGFNVSL